VALLLSAVRERFFFLHVSRTNKVYGNSVAGFKFDGSVVKKCEIGERRYCSCEMDAYTLRTSRWRALLARL
jgi:hypothetical protein